MVQIDAHSALRLIGEGALTHNTDTNTTSRNGVPCQLPSPSDPITHPILITGTNPARVQATTHRLQATGLPAWQVTQDTDQHPDATPGQ